MVSTPRASDTAHARPAKSAGSTSRQAFSSVVPDFAARSTAACASPTAALIDHGGSAQFRQFRTRNRS